MLERNKGGLITTLFACILLFAACHHRTLPIDDFAKLRVFEDDLSKLCAENSGLKCYPNIGVEFSGHHVSSITITGRNLNQLPKSIYAFQNLEKLALEETGFTELPDLKPLANLKMLQVENNDFRGLVHLRSLPNSLEYLTLNRDAITEVIVDDSLPNLSSLWLTQNRMRSHINSTFCKLPKPAFLDLSSGCCETEAQKAELETMARKILCKRDVAVRVGGDFID